MNYFPFHIGDYASATRHLSWDEDMAYRRLLDIAYTTEKPLPLEFRACCRLVLATTEAQREAVAAVLEEFFEQTPEGWVNGRAMHEIEVMQGKQEQQREKALKRWEKQRAATGNATHHAEAMPRHATTDAGAYAAASNVDADAMPPTPTPTPTPTPKKEYPPTPRRRGNVTDFPPGFESVWSAYPRKVGKAAAAKAFARIRPDQALIDRMLSAIGQQVVSPQWMRDGGQFIPHLATWLNAGRWEDQLPSMAGASIDIFAGAR